MRELESNEIVLISGGIISSQEEAAQITLGAVGVGLGIGLGVLAVAAFPATLPAVGLAAAIAPSAALAAGALAADVLGLAVIAHAIGDASGGIAGDNPSTPLNVGNGHFGGGPNGRLP